MDGPTKNKAYNEYRKKWSDKDHKIKIQCEGCGSSLLNKDVFDNKFGWLCKTCHTGGFKL